MPRPSARQGRSDQRDRAHHALQRSELLLRSQQAALAALARSATLHTGIVERAMQEITETTARTLEVERASVWLMDPKATAIHCVDLFERTSGKHSRGMELAAATLPAYFSELREERVIDAHDAQTDPRTREFRESYLEPLGISSMLDAPIHLGGKMVGVVCHEHVGPCRRWSLEEQHFAASMASIVALALEAGERLQAEETLRAAEAETRLILDNAYDAFVAIDAHDRITTWNLRAEQMFGWSREQATGRKLSETIIPPRYRERHLRGMERFLRTGEGPLLDRRIEITACRSDGTEFPVELSIRPQRSRGAFRFNAFISDISDRKKAEEELRRAKDTAQEASRAKTEFLANMSHEIRTPMNAILGMTDLLLETPLSEEQREYVMISNRAGAALLDLLNDILDLSKVEAGHLDLEEREFDLIELIERTTEMLAVRAHEKGLELVCDISPDLPSGFIGDPNRLRQVMVNLLHNAIKFTEVGEVLLRVERDEGAALSGALRFSVTDTGIGIPEAGLDAIFERFTQMDSSTTRRHGGAGLGLTISRRLVELMGGRLDVRSRVGAGSCFSFTVRLGVSDGVKEPRASREGPPALAGVRALVVDDSAANRLILRRTLTRWGALVGEAVDGGRALAEISRATMASEPYRILLLDCRMPGMDGFQVMEAMRRTDGAGEVTVMMLTSDHRVGDLARCRQLGVSRYLVKPVKRSDLLEAIRAVVSGSGAGGREMPDTETAATPPEGVAAHDGSRVLSILLVEDSRDNRILIQSYLRKLPCRIDLADNGAQAVEQFSRKRYDIVLMDVQMPVLDGYAATQRIRRWETENERTPTPILALTAYALKEDIERSLGAGCSGHLSKPIQKERLLEAILDHTRESRR